MNPRAPIATQHEHVKCERGHEQRAGHEAQVEINEERDRDQPEPKSNGALEDCRRRHDHGHAGEQKPAQANTMSAGILSDAYHRQG